MTDEDALLSSEYLHLHKVVEDFDQRVLTMKAWSVTFSAAGLALAYSETKPPILLIASLSALVFWIVEALWKTNQQAYYARIREIENSFADRRNSTTPFRISHSWGESWRRAGRYGRAFSIMLWPHVFLPHAAVVAAGLILFFLYPPAA